MAKRYRAEQVGSLLRPPEVLQAQAAQAQGKLPLEDLRHIEDKAILQAIELQKQAGVDVFSDGEFRRGNWAGDFSDAMEGYTTAEPPIRFNWRMPETAAAASEAIMTEIRGVPGQGARVIGERLRQKHRLTAHESAFLKEHAPGPYKIAMPSPSYVVARGWKPGVTDKAYPTRWDLLQDVVKIYQDEIKALLAEGVPYIQLDNPHYPDYIEESRLQQWRSIGIDPDKALAEDVAADSLALQGIDREKVTVATHLCRGNGRSAWHTQGGYERIAEPVFGHLDADVYLLEYDSDRAGGFEPLRFMPKGKTVVLGLVTTKLGQLESQETLLHRIDEASKYVAVDDLALSPQCGFASMAHGNLLSFDEQRRKLELVADTARKVWG